MALTPDEQPPDLTPLLEYDRKKLICRAERHDWPFGSPSDHWWDDFDEAGHQVGYWREITCRRCTSVLFSTMDFHGYQTNRIRRRPKDYRIPKDSGVTAKRYARLARVLRQSGPRIAPPRATD
jgi:hypothetical protein